LKTALFDYQLPKELIAYHPPTRRDGGRLLVIDPDTQKRFHRKIVELASCLPEGTLLVVNDTRVIPARLRGKRPTGGAVEVLLVRQLETYDGSCRWSTLTRANKPIKIADKIDIDGIPAEVVERGERGETVLLVEATSEEFRRHYLKRGEVPLPPYIQRDPVSDDVERYQTVYAKREGSVAAPTAGLHFGSDLLRQLEEGGIQRVSVTLHVGPGTFRPVSVENLEDHVMDSEQYLLSQETLDAIGEARREGRPVVAVGTTVTRALEGAYAKRGRLEAGSGFTDLFITPGFEFKVVNGLFTNFHLPQSTLLALVAALAGREFMLAAYEEAISMHYRFYSYGDAMLVLPRKT
jgi:S-adenosylmethionine:tRNA ribosyltransferase-isomerase